MIGTYHYIDTYRILIRIEYLYVSNIRIESIRIGYRYVEHQYVKTIDTAIRIDNRYIDTETQS